MERATKLLVVAWVLVALVAKLWLLRSAWPNLPVYVALLTIAAAALVAFDPRAIAGVLVLTYIYPALIFIGHGRYHVDFTEIWLGPLVGAMLPDALQSTWHMPRRWRRALISWALVVVVAVPLVILREMDFYPGLFLISSGPTFTARWELHVGLATLTGILWFDWLFRERAPDFTRWVAAPLAASAAIMSAVTLYQGFVDIGYLNATPYGVYRRAAGTLFDANVSGTVAALWIAGAPLLALRLDRWRWPAAIVGIALGWMAVWMTGSRTAFTAAMLVTAFLISAPWSGDGGSAFRRIGAWRVAAAAIILLLVGLTLATVRFEGSGPLQRIWDTLPTPTVASYRAFVFEMWNRNGYGTAAASMIRQYPLVGVGLGSFHGLVSNFASSRYNVLPDNAQNWYRHLFAELGVIGSLGWLEWTAVFVVFLFRRRSPASPSLWVLRGMLIALGVISLVGMPGQMMSVIITFWTLAYWYIAAADVPDTTRSLGMRQLGAVAVIVGVFAAGTLATGLTTLRPPVRAQRAGQPYSYGFYEVEPMADGSEQRWARQVAAQTIEVKGPWMELSVGVNHFDIREKAVDARVWIDGRLVVDAHLTGTDLETVYVGIRPPERWALMRTRVNRVIKPLELGIPDDRELGLIVKWRFVNAPPMGATVAFDGSR